MYDQYIKKLSISIVFSRVTLSNTNGNFFCTPLYIKSRLLIFQSVSFLSTNNAKVHDRDRTIFDKFLLTKKENILDMYIELKTS